MRFYRLDLVVYPALLAALLSMSSAVLLRRARLPASPCLSGPAYLVLDVSENLMVYWMLWTWPRFWPGLAALCGWVTLGKYIALLYALGTIFGALLVLAKRQMEGGHRHKQQ